MTDKMGTNHCSYLTTSYIHYKDQTLTQIRGIDQVTINAAPTAQLCRHDTPRCTRQCRGGEMPEFALVERRGAEMDGARTKFTVLRPLASPKERKATSQRLLKSVLTLNYTNDCCSTPWGLLTTRKITV